MYDRLSCTIWTQPFAFLYMLEIQKIIKIVKKHDILRVQMLAFLLSKTLGTFRIQEF